MGSVKDLLVLREPKLNEPGVGRFVFSDRYSVFDWGEMPDHIKNKGASICIVTAYFFERLRDIGVKSHYLGVVEDGKVKSLKDLKSPQNVLEFKLLRVIRPKVSPEGYDYSVYREERGNFLIPLEVIYRNSLPYGSSVFKRLKEGTLKIEDLGLKEVPEPGTVLERPMIDFSTKLESTDRYLTEKEAMEISSLTSKEMEKIKSTTLLIDEIITQEAKRLGLLNEDGKVEYGFDEDRNLILVDAVGSLDECRFSYEGLPVSKEIARIYYRRTDWYKEVEEAKGKDRLNWKSLVSSKPPKLPSELASLISEIYMAYANEVTGREWFKVPPLKEVLSQVKELLGL